MTGKRGEFTDGRLNWIPLWITDTLYHLDYSGLSDSDIVKQIHLWLVSAREDPVGTIPNDPKFVGNLLKISPKKSESFLNRVSKFWKLNEDTNRFEIGRIMRQGARAKSISVSRSNAGKVTSVHQVISKCSSSDDQVNPILDLDLDQEEEKIKVTKVTSSEATASDLSIFEKDLARKIKHVYRHYLSARGLSERTYSLTTTRRQKLKSRLMECRKKELIPEEKYMCCAVDACLKSEFHMGKNENGKQYCDIAKHIFPSYDKFEGWLHEAGSLGLLADLEVDE